MPEPHFCHAFVPRQNEQELRQKFSSHGTQGMRGKSQRLAPLPETPFVFMPAAGMEP